jgi:hypothetical protein
MIIDLLKRQTLKALALTTGAVVCRRRGRLSDQPCTPQHRHVTTDRGSGDAQLLGQAAQLAPRRRSPPQQGQQLAHTPLRRRLLASRIVARATLGPGVGFVVTDRPLPFESFHALLSPMVSHPKVCNVSRFAATPDATTKKTEVQCLAALVAQLAGDVHLLATLCRDVDLDIGEPEQPPEARQGFDRAEVARLLGHEDALPPLDLGELEAALGVLGVDDRDAVMVEPAQHDLVDEEPLQLTRLAPAELHRQLVAPRIHRRRDDQALFHLPTEELSQRVLGHQRRVADRPR